MGHRRWSGLRRLSFVGGFCITSLFVYFVLLLFPPPVLLSHDLFDEIENPLARTIYPRHDGQKLCERKRSNWEDCRLSRDGCSLQYSLLGLKASDTIQQLSMEYLV